MPTLNEFLEKALKNTPKEEKLDEAVSDLKSYKDSWTQIHPALIWIADGRIKDPEQILRRVKIAAERAEGIKSGMEILEENHKKLIDSLSWIAGAFNTALNTQKQYEVVKENKNTRKKLKDIFTMIKKNK